MQIAIGVRFLEFETIFLLHPFVPFVNVQPLVRFRCGEVFTIEMLGFFARMPTAACAIGTLLALPRVSAVQDFADEGLNTFGLNQ